ncbi:MAG: acylphosphatase [Candidatus Aminicenantes bacterium]|nr:acylphosphatase [Candidatus Aminicenantes bacterium]
MIQRFRAFVRGEVQGVSFRWFVSREASHLGLLGWVRNREDGRVEVLAEGEREDLDVLIFRLGRGPLPARVVDVSLQWEAASGDLEGFRIERTV